MSPGLRERKKEQTRQAISDTATRLFLERGFEKVTIAEIALAAEVAKMTVTNYFPRKEDLAIDRHREFTEALARAVAERQPGESALAAVRRETMAALKRRDPLIGFSGKDFARMVAHSPTLTARIRELHDLRGAALARVLAEETAARDRTPDIVAGLLVAAHRTVFDQVTEQTLAGAADQDIAAAAQRSARRAFELLEPALGTYAVRPEDAPTTG